LLTDLYSLPSSDFHDITIGFNGYSAKAGYDLVTGLGTPKANLVIAGLLADSGVSASSATVKSGAVGTSTSSSSTGQKLDQVSSQTNGSTSGGASATNTGSTGIGPATATTTPFVAVLPARPSNTQANGLTAQPAVGNSATTPPIGQVSATAPS